MASNVQAGTLQTRTGARASDAKRSRMKRWSWALAVLVTAGIYGAGCSIVATHEEYTAYRAVRLASNDDERMVAMADYATHYPNGFWAGDIRREREAREQGIWLSGNATQEGLQRYLAAYPDGTYAEQAHARLAAVSHVEEHREVEQEHVEEVQRVDAEAQAAQRRLWVTQATTFWGRTLLGIRNYGQPISGVARANPEFSAAFGSAPAPMCTPTHCLKHYHAHYAIPVPGATRIEREMQMFLRIRLENGRMERVEVLLPNMGFSRWYELENRTLVTDEDPTQRQQAIEWALGQLMPTITEAGAGGHAIDVIPEPIESITASESAASQTTEEADTEVEQEEAAVAQAQPAPTQEEGASGGDDSLEALLAAAAGVDSGTPDEAAVEVAPGDSGAEMVLPVGLYAWQLRNVRIVVFAAGEGDYGDGFDGFYVERARD